MTEFASGLASSYRDSTARNYVDTSTRSGAFRNVTADKGYLESKYVEPSSSAQKQPAQSYSDPSLARISAQRYELEARVEQKKTFDLHLVTQDGDVISIEFDLAKILEFSDYRSQTSLGAINGASFFDALETESRSSLSFASFKELDIQVIGELDAGELKALDELFADLDKLSQSFFGGEFSRAQELAASFQLDTTEFAGIDLQLGSQASYKAVESYRSVQAISSSNSSANNFSPSAVSSNGSASLFELLNQAESRVEEFSEAQKLAFSDRSYQDLLSLFIKSVEEQLEKQFMLIDANKSNAPDEPRDKNIDQSNSDQSVDQA